MMWPSHHEHHTYFFVNVNQNYKRENGAFVLQITINKKLLWFSDCAG